MLIYPVRFITIYKHGISMVLKPTGNDSRDAFGPEIQRPDTKSFSDRLKRAASSFDYGNDWRSQDTGIGGTDRNRARGSEFFDSEVKQTSASFGTGNRRLDTRDLQIREPVKTIEEALARLQKHLNDIKQRDALLLPGEKGLVDTDPVTVALDRELGSRGAPSTLSERRLDKLTFALLDHHGFKIDTTVGGAALVTLNGETVKLTPLQHKLFKTGNERADLNAFGMSLLQSTEIREDVKLLVGAAAALRAQYTEKKVSIFVDQGQDVNALAALGTNMSATITEQEREIVLSAADQSRFTEEYFREKIRKAYTDAGGGKGGADAVGVYLQEVGEVAPHEISARVLDAFKKEFDPSWFEKDWSKVNTSTFDPTQHNASRANGEKSMLGWRHWRKICRKANFGIFQDGLPGTTMGCSKHSRYMLTMPSRMRVEMAMWSCQVLLPSILARGLRQNLRQN